MKWTIPQRTLLLALFFVTGLYGSEKPALTKVAEGSYVRKSSSGSERLDRWVLWRRADRTYQLSSSLFPDAGNPAGVALDQITDFDADFKMQRFVLKGRDEKQTGKLSCELTSTRLTCQSEMNGHSSSGSTVVEGPYVVAPIQEGEHNDVPWLLAPMLRLAARDPKILTAIQYLIFWPGENFEFEPLLRVQVHYLGQDTVQVMGRKVTAQRYEELPERVEIWTASNGVVLAYEQHGSGEDYRVELVDLRQYVDFLPELK